MPQSIPTQVIEQYGKEPKNKKSMRVCQNGSILKRMTVSLWYGLYGLLKAQQALS